LRAVLDGNASGCGGFLFCCFDCLEPNVSQDVREQRMIHVGALAVPLNLRIVDAGRRLTASCHLCIGIWYNPRRRSGHRVAGRGDWRSLK